MARVLESLEPLAPLEGLTSYSFELFLQPFYLCLLPIIRLQRSLLYILEGCLPFLSLRLRFGESLLQAWQLLLKLFQACVLLLSVGGAGAVHARCMRSLMPPSVMNSCSSFFRNDIIILSMKRHSVMA